MNGAQDAALGGPHPRQPRCTHAASYPWICRCTTPTATLRLSASAYAMNTTSSRCLCSTLFVLIVDAVAVYLGAISLGQGRQGLLVEDHSDAQGAAGAVRDILTVVQVF
jgi:hypothetical protein